MPDGSLVTGRVAQPAVGGEPPAVEEPVATVKPKAKAAVSPEPVAIARRPEPVAPKPAAPAAVSPEPQYAEVTVPAGTTLSLRLDSALASDVSQVEDPVRARIERPVMVNSMHAIPEGSMVFGTVTTVEASGKVQGRATLAFRFDQLNVDSHRYVVHSDTVSYHAESTKAEDAKKIGIGAGAGAIIGGLLGGKKGAGTGAAIGGGAGTAMVLTTAGEEVKLRAGTPVEVSLTQPLTLLICTSYDLI